MKILDFFDLPDASCWLEQIRSCHWQDGKYLYRLLRTRQLRARYGKDARLFLLTEKDALIAFCLYSACPEPPEHPMTPWVGFIYTFPPYRGKRRSGLLIAHVREYARQSGIDSLWVSTAETGLPERYGFIRSTHGGRWEIYHMDLRRPDYRSVIGQTVTGRIDRPYGTAHPRHPDLIYPVNYGYATGITGGDGAWQDVYFFGPRSPVAEFSGRIVAVWHRVNDVEDKWIVSAEEPGPSDAEILQTIFFQEQYFIGELIR